MLWIAVCVLVHTSCQAADKVGWYSQDSCAYLAFKRPVTSSMPRHINYLLDVLQMIEVLIAMTNVVSQHAANQALLVPLSEPLTEALAAWLSTFPSITPEAANPPQSPLTSLPSCTGTSAQSDMTALKKNSSTGAEPNSTAPHTAAHDSSCNAQKLPTSALTSQLKMPKQPSLLTAKLRDSTPIKTKTLDPSASASPSASVSLPHAAASTQRGETSKKSHRQEEDGEVQLARRFVYHLLLHLPVEVLRDRQAFWMEHAVGLPELMQCCLGVAVMQDPTVSQHHHIVNIALVEFCTLNPVTHVKLCVDVTHVMLFCGDV